MHGDSCTLEFLRLTSHVSDRGMHSPRFASSTTGLPPPFFATGQSLHDYGIPCPALARTRHDSPMNDFVCPTLVDIRSAAAHIVPFAVVSPPYSATTCWMKRLVRRWASSVNPFAMTRSTQH